jgi:hypothetical protein
MRALWLAVFVACSHPGTGFEASAPEPLDVHPATALDTTPKNRARMLPPEAFLRAYLMWFGGLTALDVKKRGGALFDRWEDYLAALGLPDYAHEFPRVTQSNTMMLASLERLAEILCIRAAEHDLHGGKQPISSRVVFAFDARPHPTLPEFATSFDVLHRTFLGYPAELAPRGRTEEFYALYQQALAHHTDTGPLTPDETAWVAVCTALVIHPEAQLY